MYDILELNKKLVSELRDIAKQLKIKKIDSLKKQDLVYKILNRKMKEDEYYDYLWGRRPIFKLSGGFRVNAGDTIESIFERKKE